MFFYFILYGTGDTCYFTSFSMEQVTHVSRLTFMKGKYKNRSNVTGLEPFKRHWIRTVQTSLD